MEIPLSFMNDDEKSKHEIKIHNPWSDTTIRTYDLKVAAAHLIYKSHRAPPSAVHRHIELTIGEVRYDIQPKPFPMPQPGGVSIDDVLQEIVEEIRYCVDLHDAMYVD